MEESQWITLIVGLLTIAGTLIAAHWQLRRDGKSIDGISSDTSQMKPKVENIEDIAKAQAKDIGLLVSDLDHRKRLEAEFPQGMSGRDLISIGSNRMIEENAQLNRQYQELNLLYLKAQNSVNELQAENAQLRSQISELKAELEKEQTPNRYCGTLDDFEPEL